MFWANLEKIGTSDPQISQTCTTVRPTPKKCTSDTVLNDFLLGLQPSILLFKIVCDLLCKMRFLLYGDEEKKKNHRTIHRVLNFILLF